MELIDIQLFGNLGENELRKLLKTSKRVKLKKNEFLYTPNEVCDSLSVVITGKLRASKILPSGYEQVIRYLGEGDVFGEGFVFTGKNYQTHVIGETASEVLEIPKRTLLRAFSNEEFLLSFLKTFSDKISNLSNLIDTLSLRTTKQRVAKYLIDLCNSNESLVFTLPNSKREIADNLGTSREVVSRIFSSLQSNGVIKLTKNTVEVLDTNKLEKLYLNA